MERADPGAKRAFNAARGGGDNLEQASREQWVPDDPQLQPFSTSATLVNCRDGGGGTDTNCSETMSETNGEEEYTDNNNNNNSSGNRTVWDCLANRHNKLQKSVKNRIGTPHHRPAAITATPGDIQQSDNAGERLSQQHYLASGEDTTEPVETLSLDTSNQAPPSYGTATRVLAANQIHHSPRNIGPGSSSQALATNQSKPLLSNQVELARKETFGGYLSTGSAGLLQNGDLLRCGNQQQQQQQVMQRPIDLRQDNNQELNQLNWPQLQQQHQHQLPQTLTSNLKFSQHPINHVISDDRKPWPTTPQANQYYSQGQQIHRIQPPAPSQILGSTLLIQTDASQDGLNQASAARIMDNNSTLAAWPRQHHQQQQHQQALANRDKLQPSPSISAICVGPLAATANATMTSVHSMGASASSMQPLAVATTAAAATTTTQHQCISDHQYSGQLFGGPASSKVSPLRRSDEELDGKEVARSSRRQQHQQQQQQQQQHHLQRKRRRHRSTSGRSVSPAAAGEQLLRQHQPQNLSGASMEMMMTTKQQMHLRLAATMSRRPQPTSSLSHYRAASGSETAENATRSQTQKGQHQQQTISAHCWLIDSSDDQSPYGTAKGDNARLGIGGNGNLSGKAVTLSEDQTDCLPRIQQPQQNVHLTVAMQQQQLRKQQLNSSGCLQDPSDREQQPIYAARNPNDLTFSLKTNSLRMERILSRNEQQQQCKSKQAAGGSCKDIKSAGQRQNASSMDRRKVQKNNEQRDKRRRSSSEGSSPNSVISNSGATGQYHAASTVARLSALLSIISGLVKRKRVAVSGNELQDHPADSMAQSVSGSIAAAGGNTLAPYTTGSLAISSSSSTSAYATESSRDQSTSTSGRSRLLALSAANVATDRRELPLISLSRLNGNASCSGASTKAGSSFYSSSTGGPQSGTFSQHSYEYCDQNDLDETGFTVINLNSDAPQPPALSNVQSHVACDEFVERSTSGGSNDVEDDRVAPLRGFSETRQALMSDNELISMGGGSEAGFEQLPGAARFVAQTTPSAARRRWWWNSLKDWLCRRPCQSDRSPASSECGHQQPLAGGPVQLPASGYPNGIETSRYKTLRAEPPHTIQNILSLAKADRVFRIRLIASLLVSVLLLGLICLLIGLIYARSNSKYSQKSDGSALSLLVDDSDYDLSWLWPSTTRRYPQPTRAGSTTSRGGSRGGRLLPAELQSHMPRSQEETSTDRLMLDEDLRTKLDDIESSERLNQLQLTMSHLTTIQLANDNFIDLTQLAKQLAPPVELDISNLTSTTSANDLRHGNYNASDVSFNTTGYNKQTTAKSPVLLLSETDLDLVSLCLLSNLNWPLVKWRHQSQQSVANFLSFALPTPSSASTQTAVAHSLRNLLSALLLAEQSQKRSWHSNQNSRPLGPIANKLIQFLHLDSLLRTTSYHLISCSTQLPIPVTNAAHEHYRPRKLFCNRLIARYKRMMRLMTNLDQQQLSNLHEDSSINLETGSIQQERSKTLVAYFLDRLSLLSPRLLAESILSDALATEDPPFEFSLDHILVESHSSPQRHQIFDQKITLYELAKMVIGDGPTAQMSLHKFDQLDPDPATNHQHPANREEFMAKVQQMEQSGDSNTWHNFLSTNLLSPWPSTNLPLFIVPLNYDLFLQPNLTTRFVLGMVKIEFKLTRPTRFLVINSDQLNILEITLWSRSPVQQPSASASDPIEVGASAKVNDSSQAQTPSSLDFISIRRVLINERLQQIYIELYEQLEPSITPAIYQHEPLNFGEIPARESNYIESQFLLNISFNKTNLMGSQQQKEHGRIATNELQFIQYGDYYAQSEIETKTLLYTQLEPTNARRLFPSFDQPQFKAKFQLNLVHELNHQVFFNAPKRERVPYTTDGLQMSVFEQTRIPISTYLVSFVVCDAQNIKSITSRVPQTVLARHTQQNPVRHIQVQVSAQWELIGQAEFASQLVPQLLAFYQTHLQFPYPSEKLDLIAIPKPMAIDRTTTNTMSQGVGAAKQQIDTMENMGLIWFKANLLLVDTNLIGQNLIEQVSMIIAHQLAHQYFGNIVSVKRWDDLWLYEALCQYLESVAIDNIQPDWRLDEQFLVGSIQETLASDYTFLADLTQAPMLRSDPEILDIEPESLSYKDGNNLNHDTYEGLDATDEFNQNQRILGNEAGQISSTELRRNTAVLHMLMLNLLPTQEARARLLRRCLNVHQQGSMSTGDFWLNFGKQLNYEGSFDRLTLDATKFINDPRFLDKESKAQGDSAYGNSYALGHPTNAAINLTNIVDDSQAISLDLPQPMSQSADQLSIGESERIVYVGPRKSISPNHVAKQSAENIYHRIRSRSTSRRLSDNLDLIAEAWFERAGYPLITASAYRDRILLKQERFSNAWWSATIENSQVDDKLASSEVLPVSGSNWTWHSSKTNTNRDKQTAMPNQELDDVWPIPLMLVSRYDPKQPSFLWLDKRQIELPFSDLHHSSTSDAYSLQPVDSVSMRKGNFASFGSQNAWFKLNVNQTSLVRVNYDERNWEALTDLLFKSHYSNHQLSSLDRANLIDDALTLMRCGKLSVGIAMNLTLYLEVGEREYQPWTSALRHLDQMQTLLNQNPVWHSYVLKLLQPISSVIGWKDDGPHLMRKLRRTLFSVALQYGDEKISNKARQEFKGWYKNGRFIVPNLQELVFVAGVRHGEQQEWFHCWQKYQQLVAMDNIGQRNLVNGSDDLITMNQRDRQPSGGGSGAFPMPPVLPISESNEPNIENEKRQLLTALSSTQNTWLLEQFLNYSMDPTKIQSHHLKHVIQTLGKNPVARLYLWRFVRLNWNQLIERHMMVSPKSYTTTNDQTAKGKRGSMDLTIIDNYSDILETMIIESTKHFSLKLDYEEVKSFFDSKRKQNQQHLNLDISTWSASLESAIQRSLQVIKSNIYWRDNIEPKLTKWLSHYDGTTVINQLI